VTQSHIGDPRFFVRNGPRTLSAVVEAASGRAIWKELVIEGVAPLETAGPREVSFLDNRKYIPHLEKTKAGAVIVHPDLSDRVPRQTVAIETESPYEGWARVASLFYPEPAVSPGLHPTAIVDPSAHIDPLAEIGPYCVVGADAEIGPRCRLGAHVAIGAGVVLGPDCRVGEHASLSHAILGARVFVYPGVRIGQGGFGFAPTNSGFLSVPQLGRVIIEDDVEIGSNSTVDRGSTGDTVIGAGTRIDNLVQIAHNVKLGRCCVIVAQVGIAGSTVVEDFVQLGGQSALAGHLRVGQAARIGAQAGVMSDVAAGDVLLGSPAQPRRQFFKQIAILKRLAQKTMASGSRAL
jgi:UDP-3-O-[3-hydroxymyristoyl] glucosamine N-acyltransferase